MTTASPTAAAVVRRAAAEHGNQPLLLLPGSLLTFAEAEARSRLVAKHLLASGVGKGTRVGLHFGYGAEFVVAFLAAARVGALVAPLSTAYAPAELRTALRRADVDTLLVPSRDATLEAVPELTAVGGPGRHTVVELPYLRQVHVLGEIAEAALPAGVDDALLERVEAEIAPSDLLVLIQTSGSTAEPKGVLHTHGAVFRKTAGGPVLPGPIFLAMPFFWVGGLLSLCTALQTGVTLLCQERFEPAGALDLIEEHRAVVVASWFTVIQALRTHPSTAARDLSCIPMLTRSPGEVPYEIPLGMTETLGPHTVVPDPVHGFDLPPHLWGSNGGSGPSVEHRLVDPESGREVCGDGEGELWVRGPGVLAGMYKREQATVFEPDGWYRTGDLVRRQEGLWWFVGRTTEMIKVKGANVAPPEVEVVLEARPEVKHAFVLGVPHPDRGEEVAAVVVPADGATIDVDALRDAAGRALSRFKVPTRLLCLDEDQVPWLATGKPDKRAMREILARA